MNNSRFILGISFFLAGFFSLLKYLNIVNIPGEQIIGGAIIFYALPTVYISLEKGRRDKLIWATILFCISVVLVVKSYFEILDTRGIIFASILFTSGTVLLLLFIENMKEKIFFISSLILILLSYLTVTYFKNLGLFETANKIGNIVEIFWPVILIILGIGIYIDRNK
ncbi:MAG: hypothetical protein NTX65_08395 [Ignavibacteriales bacterium]|nr:hypothetical protein [Ignavibacteriales bacterium]